MSIIGQIVGTAESNAAYISDATAKIWDVTAGKTAYIATGKVTGTETDALAMMQYDGVTGYYRKSSTMPSHTGVTCVLRCKIAAFTGGDLQYLFQRNVTTGGYLCNIIVHASDYATTARRSKLVFVVQNSTGTTVCRIFTSIVVCDNSLHNLFMSYNASAGTAMLVMDGVDVLDTGNGEHILTTGTLSTGAATYGVGAQPNATQPLLGDMGFFGFREASLTNWSDFFQADGTPKAIDESGWTEWGAQPLFWNEHGYMADNKGSAGNMQPLGLIGVYVDGDTVFSKKYTPAMMKFGGTTSKYTKAITSAGNKQTYICRFSLASFTGGDFMYFAHLPGAGTQLRLQVVAFASDYVTVDFRDRIRFHVFNSAGTAICSLLANNLLDGNNHTVFFSFDADAGTAMLYADGVTVDETGNASRVAPTTGTLDSGAGTLSFAGVSSNHFNSQMGFIGYSETYRTNPLDFMQADGSPKAINETAWTEWGAQPLVWNEHGDLSLGNLGSLGALTKTGTITIGKGGN